MQKISKPFFCNCARLALPLPTKEYKMETADILRTLREFKLKRGKEFGIVSLGLFGSVARGQQHEGSDIDVCVELEKPSFFTRMDLRHELEKIFCCKVDVISLKSIMRPLFRKSLDHDAIFV